MISSDRDPFGFPIPSESRDVDEALLQPTISKPGREEFRRTEIAKRIDQAKPVPEDLQPILWLMAGGSGTGKSTILKKLQEEGVVAQDNVVHIDPDDFKNVIPEFKELIKRKDSRAAEVVHVESGMMAREALNGAMARRTNIIYDSTLSNRAKAYALIRKARENGYQIRIIAVTAGPQTALERVRERGDRTGRYVPVKDLLATHKKFARFFEHYVPLADFVELWKTDCRDGKTEEKIAEKTDGYLDILFESEYAEFAKSANLNENATTPDEI
jgi:predicted ABC-type ATPase